MEVICVELACNFHICLLRRAQAFVFDGTNPVGLNALPNDFSLCIVSVNSSSPCYKALRAAAVGFSVALLCLSIYRFVNNLG